MAKPFALFSGAGLGAGVGAGLMYYLDPERGRRRRARLRNQARYSIRQANHAAAGAARDAFSRVYGSAVESLSAWRQKSAADEELQQRVLSSLNRHVSHPSSVRVAACRGRVTLSGRILRNEIDQFVSAVESIRGVECVENELDALDGSQAGVSSAAGATSRMAGRSATQSGARPAAAKPWSSTTRLAAGAAGAALVANCVARRTPLAIWLGTFGVGLCARAATNRDTAELLGLSGDSAGVEVEDTIVIDAATERVFDLFSDPTNMPRLTDAVQSVTCLGGSRYEKRARGPGGKEIVLTEIITQCDPPEFLAWKSGHDSAIRYSGEAQFTALNGRKTEVHVTFRYHPPGGILGHSAARLLGIDPKRRLTDVLLRAKAFLETGRRPRDIADDSPINVGQAEQSR